MVSFHELCDDFWENGGPLSMNIYLGGLYH